MADQFDYVINKKSGNKGCIHHKLPYMGEDTHWKNTIMYHIRIKGRYHYVLEENLERLYDIIPRGIKVMSNEDK